ncbi:MAG: hypothetical protein FWH55_10925 [Oscillospiraceae bacterium]|nr:hypothetical protein [Oscillospiraceae bacterium]
MSPPAILDKRILRRCPICGEGDELRSERQASSAFASKSIAPQNPLVKDASRRACGRGGWIVLDADLGAQAPNLEAIDITVFSD